MDTSQILAESAVLRTIGSIILLADCIISAPTLLVMLLVFL